MLLIIDLLLKAATMSSLDPVERHSVQWFVIARETQREVLTRRWVFWWSFDILRDQVGYGCRPTGIRETHYVGGPPNFRWLRLCDRRGGRSA